MTMDEQLGRIARELEATGHILTRQRKMIMEVLLGQASSYLTAEDIFLQIKRHKRPIGMATVYRTVELLSELRFVHKVTVRDKPSRFSLRHDPCAHARSQLICHVCGESEPMQADWLADVDQRVKSEFGFHVVTHEFDMVGTYAACKQGICKKTDRPVQESDL